MRLQVMHLQALTVRSVTRTLYKETCWHYDFAARTSLSEIKPLMPPAETAKQALENLKRQVNTVEQQQETFDKKLESKAGNKSLLGVCSIATILIVAVVGFYLNDRSFKDRSVDTSIVSMRSDITRNGERLAKVESKLDLLLTALLKDIASGSTEQIKQSSLQPKWY